MKDIQSVLVMSRQNSGFYGKDIPYLDFDSEAQHETTAGDFREFGPVPGLSMMDLTERLIEMTTVNEDDQDPQATVDRMTLITLNVAVTSATDTTSDLSGAMTSGALDCWQASAPSHRMSTSERLNVPVAVQTLFNEGGVDGVYPGRSQPSSSSEAFTLENTATRSVNPYDLQFSHSVVNLPQHREDGVSNNTQTFQSESLSETLDMYGISKEDLRTDINFPDKITPPVSIAPLVTLSMLLEEDNLCDSNLSTSASGSTCMHNNNIYVAGDKCKKCSRTLTNEHFPHNQKQSSNVDPFSAHIPDQSFNLFKKTPGNLGGSQSVQSTPASAFKVNLSLSRSSETTSNILASSPELTGCVPLVTFNQDKNIASDNLPSHTEICSTPDVKSMPNWEPIFLSLTDLDIQSEIEVVENRLTDFDNLNTPTDIPKDALGGQSESMKKQLLAESHLSRQTSHLQKTTSTLSHIYDPGNKRASPAEGSFFSFNLDEIQTLNPQTPQPVDSVSFSTTKTKSPCKEHDTENTTTLVHEQKSQMFSHDMSIRKANIQNVDNTNRSYVNSLPSTSFSKPILSELSSDALLSPGDVDKAFLGYLGTKSYSSQLYSSFDGNTSDISSSISSSLPEADNQEQAPVSGDNLKIKLRSRLKAKGVATDRPAVNLSIETSGSSSTTDNQMLNIAPRSSPRNMYYQKRKSSENSSESSNAKKVCVSSSSNVSDTGSSDEEDDITSYFAASESNRQKQLSGRQEEEEEDEETKLAKREKNRIAAQKCRHKKRDKIESLTRQVQRLENRQDKIKTEVEKLNEEREQLEEMLRVHSFVCQRGQNSQSHAH